MSDDLPMGWVVSEIGTVVEAFQTTDPQKFAENSFTYVDIGSIDNQKQIISDPKKFLGKDAPSRARRVIKKGDTLFSTVRTYLKNIALVPKELDNCLTSTGICILRPSKYIDSRYLFNWVKSDQFVNSMSVAMDGTMYPAVNDSDVYSGEIPVAPLNEQRRIVDKLERISDRHRTAGNELNHIPKLIARYKQAVLAAAYSGKLTEDWRIRKNVSLEFCEYRLISVAKFIDYRGKTPTKTNSGIPLITAKNIRQGYLSIEPKEYIAEEDYQSWMTRGIPRIGDVLITTEAPLGNIVCIDWNFKFALAQRSICLQFIPDVAYGKYASLAMQAPEFQNILNEQSTGSTVKGIKASRLKEINISLPPLEEQKEIVRRVEKMFEKIDTMEQEYQQAAKLCDRLEQATLAKAFRGELVPQDPHDEPASVLLEQVKREKEKGKIKTKK